MRDERAVQPLLHYLYMLKKKSRDSSIENTSFSLISMKRPWYIMVVMESPPLEHVFYNQAQQWRLN